MFVPEAQASSSKTEGFALNLTAATKISEDVPPVTRAVNCHSRPEILSMVLPVQLFGRDDRVVKTYALLDSGSNVSLLDEEVCSALKLKGQRETLRLQWTSDVSMQEDALRFDMKIADPNGRERFKMENMFSKRNLNLSRHTQQGKSFKGSFPICERFLFATSKTFNRNY